jgi:hypothetical protein
MKLIESSIKESTKIDHPTTFLRAHFLCGAYTQKHADYFRGNWYTYIIAFDEGYEYFHYPFSKLQNQCG